MSLKQVLIFDSGVGGLSICKEIVDLGIVADCNYLFDNAYFPYGELTDKALITRLTQLLSDFASQHPTDLIVIACNSASTVALQTLRTHFDIPIIGVVPAIKPASLLTKNNIIGLLATPATVKRAYTDQLIAQFASDKRVLKIGTTELVKLAEDKLTGNRIDLDVLKTVLKPWIESKSPPDTIVLGCTHFPWLKNEISFCFQEVGKKIQLVDSGDAIAKRTQQLLGSEKLNDRMSIYHAFYTKDYQTIAAEQEVRLRFTAYGFGSLTLF